MAVLLSPSTRILLFYESQLILNGALAAGRELDILTMAHWQMLLTILRMRSDIRVDFYENHLQPREF